jgi:hypothetical protein
MNLRHQVSTSFVGDGRPFAGSTVGAKSNVSTGKRLEYKHGVMGSLCMTYQANKVISGPEHGMVTLKFFVTTVGDVLRRLFIHAPDPLIDKHDVRITLQCGLTKIVDSVSWQAWHIKCHQHDMSNELPLLNDAGEHVKWPFFGVTQDCLEVLLTVPASQEKRGKPAGGWSLHAVWDLMSSEWRSDCTFSQMLLCLNTPVKHRLCILNGQLRSVDSIEPKREHRDAREAAKRMSNPFV